MSGGASVSSGEGGLLELNFTVDGEDVVEREFVTFGREVSDLSEAWEGIAGDLRFDDEVNFDTEGDLFQRADWSDADGVKRSDRGWDLLADRTVAERRRLGYGPEHPILERSGTLRESLTEHDAIGAVEIVEPMGLTFGTAIPYAKYHQQPNGSGSGRIPRRAILGLTQQRKAGVVRRVAAAVRGKIVAAGLPAVVDVGGADAAEE